MSEKSMDVDRRKEKKKKDGSDDENILKIYALIFFFLLFSVVNYISWDHNPWFSRFYSNIFDYLAIIQLLFVFGALGTNYGVIQC